MNLQGLAVASLHQSYVNHYVCFTTLLQKMSLKLISVLLYAESDVSCSAFVLWRLFKPTGRRFFACVLLLFALQEIIESFTSFNYHFKLLCAEHSSTADTLLVAVVTQEGTVLLSCTREEI